MTSLRDAHGHAFFAESEIRQPDKTKHDDVTRSGGRFQELRLIAGRIGKNRLESEALSLSEEPAPQDVRRFSGRIGFQVQLARQNIGGYVPERGGGDV